MKKLNIILIVLIFLVGGFLLFSQLNGRKPVEENSGIKPNTEETNPINEETTVVGVRPVAEEKDTLSEEQLIMDIKNKKYLESTFMALEYTKINNAQLASTLKGYLENNTKMKPEDVVNLIEIHEKTFLNRYLKVFVMSPTSEYNYLNKEMRRIFYQIKNGFDIINKYEVLPVAKDTTDTNGVVEVGASANVKSSKEEVTYDPNAISTGINQLLSVESHINDALNKLGVVDTEIETRWVEYGLTEHEILEILNNTNPDFISIDLGGEDTYEDIYIEDFEEFEDTFFNDSEYFEDDEE